MLNTLFKSICSGILITIGGSVFLACDNKYCGAVFFSVALLSICYQGYYLFTGKIGFFPENRTSENALTLLTGLMGNLATTYACGLLIRTVLPALGEKANTICLSKLTQTSFETFVRGVFCGVLMYLAVVIYRDKKSVWGIFFCVPVFILSGFEHSIADMFYFGTSGIFDWKILLFTLSVVLGNTVGGMLLPILSKIGEKNEKQ